MKLRCARVELRGSCSQVDADPATKRRAAWNRVPRTFDRRISILRAWPFGPSPSPDCLNRQHPCAGRHGRCVVGGPTHIRGFILKTKLLPLVLLSLSQGVLAQQLPQAGSQLQQLPPPPAPQAPAAPAIRIEETTGPAVPGSE